MQRLETREPQLLGRRERLVGGTGIVAALLVVVGFIMAGNVPTSDSSFEKVVTSLFLLWVGATSISMLSRSKTSR